MQMIDVLKRLAELDAQNPNIVKESSQSVEECGMMGGMDRPSTPATINMTAATGEELSSMLKDIMTLAGQRAHSDHHDHMDEPVGGADGMAVVDVEPSDSDSPSIMRSMMDKLHPENEEILGALGGGAVGAAVGGPLGALTGAAAGDSLTDPDHDEVKEYDNEPQPEVAGMDAAVPSGNDMHKEKKQFPAAQPGDNAMAATFESLMAEYRKFLGEEQGVAEDRLSQIQSQAMALSRKANAVGVGKEWAHMLKTGSTEKINAALDLAWDKVDGAAMTGLMTSLQEIVDYLSGESNYLPSNTKEQRVAEGMSESEYDTMGSMLQLAGLKR
jgi:hypothetical protein